MLPALPVSGVACHFPNGSFVLPPIRLAAILYHKTDIPFYAFNLLSDFIHFSLKIPTLE
jgi:hypothetical protein